MSVDTSMADPNYIREADTNRDGKNSKKELREYRTSGKAAMDRAAALELSYAVIKQDPELYSWFERKTREYLDNPAAFSKENFFLELDAQPFSQKYSKAAIADMDFELRFPDVWKEQVNGLVESLRDQAIQVGAQMTDEQLRELAIRKRRMALNDAQTTNALVDYVGASNEVMQGQAGQLQRGLKDWARRNGISLSEQMIGNYSREILRGNRTESDVLQDLRRTYMTGAYPAWADRIEAGFDIADIAEPYRAKMAELLEIDEGMIDLNDTLLQRGLQGVGGDGKPKVIPLYEFEREVRNDPRWQKTDNAYKTYSEAADTILSMFGMR